MCGGGGGGSYQMQDNSLQVEMQRQQAAQQEQARQDALKAQQRTDFTNNYQAALGTGRQRGLDLMSSLGITPDAGLIDSITSEIGSSVPDLDVKPEQYFTTDAYQAGLNKRQDASRQNYSRQVNDKFFQGFEDYMLPDNSIDSIIDSILGQQSTVAKQSIDANQKRGLLNDTGYQNALGEFGNQSNAGRSTLRGIGESVLGTKRGELTAIKGQAGDAASNYSLGSAAPDVNSYWNRAQNEAWSDWGDLEGSIRAALGSTSLFDVPSALAKGGTMQGGINLTTQSGLAPFSDEAKRKSTGRGLGSTGTF